MNNEHSVVIKSVPVGVLVWQWLEQMLISHKLQDEPLLDHLQTVQRKKALQQISVVFKNSNHIVHYIGNRDSILEKSFHTANGIFECN